MKLEELFCKLYPEYSVNGKPLSPYFDLFERGYEEAENKLKCCGNCKNEGDYKEPYRYGTGWCNICKRHKVAKGNFDKWEIKEKC